MTTRELAVISIRPDPARPLGLDLGSILAAFGDRLARWVWCVRDLDWLGEDDEAFCRAVEAAGPHGLWLASDELLAHARGIHQTVEGTFLAFPGSLAPAAIRDDELLLASFPTSRAEVAIEAVDGILFDVHTKSPEIAENLLRRFSGAHAEDPTCYYP
jgi:hypothetical protein